MESSKKTDRKNRLTLLFWIFLSVSHAKFHLKSIFSPRHQKLEVHVLNHCCQHHRFEEAQTTLFSSQESSSRTYCIRKKLLQKRGPDCRLAWLVVDVCHGRDAVQCPLRRDSIADILDRVPVGVACPVWLLIHQATRLTCVVAQGDALAVHRGSASWRLVAGAWRPPGSAR